MQQILITTQEQLDKLTQVEKDQEVTIDAELRLGGILKVFGTLQINKKLDCDYWKDRFVHAWDQATVHAGGQAMVHAGGQATVHAWDQATVRAWDQATVHAWDQATVRAWDQATVHAGDQATVHAGGQATVRAGGQTTVRAWDQATVHAGGQTTVHAWDQATVHAGGQATVRALSDSIKTVLLGFSVGILGFNCKASFTKKSKTAIVHKVGVGDWFENNGIGKKAKVILYKRVSKDFKTQEGNPNETQWIIGKTIVHPKWEPAKDECGEGKYHACSMPYFCDEFRSTSEDRYIALEIRRQDTYAWPHPSYPHKIGFRQGKVLYECDAFGKEIKESSTESKDKKDDMEKIKTH